MSTPHIGLIDKSKMAKTVLMPGDPLRAKYIAETFLTNVEKINCVRNMLGYTGDYNGKKVTVMGSGMGMPSIGIYSYELFKFYDVENIIRIGSAGSYDKDLHVYDVILATSAWTESTYAKAFGLGNKKILTPNKVLNNRILKSAKKLGYTIHQGRIHSSDVFYRLNESEWEVINRKFDCKCVEMESFALFANAKALGKKAACILTISDSLVTGEVTSAEARQTSFRRMMEIALNI